MTQKCTYSGSVVRDSEVNHIIKRAMLSNGDKYRLMVSGRIDGREAVDASGKTVRDVGSDHAALSSTVDTLEECEASRVGWCGLVQRVELLNDDVCVTNDRALAVHSILRGTNVNSHSA